MTTLSIGQAAEFLYREALLLDRLELEQWLELYSADCVFWMPAWRDDGTQTEDPHAEISLIYYRGRRNLEDRVRRIRSGFSVASAVMPRVSHIVGNILISGATDGCVQLESSFIVNVHDVRTRRAHGYFGRYEHELRWDGEEWKITRKVVRLMNDVIPTLLDVYSI